MRCTGACGEQRSLPLDVGATNGLTRLTCPGDETAVQAAFARIRSDFAKPVSGEEELHKRMADGRGVVSVLRHNVIQGQLNDKGSYALRMHSEIEMGDNETIKLGRNRTSELLASTKATKKCGG